MNRYRVLSAASLFALAGLSIAPIDTAHAADTSSGNPIPGVCMLSREAVYSNAKIGLAANARLNQLAEQSRDQLVAERKPLDADVQSFQQRSSSMTDAQRKQQGEALQERLQMFQAQADATSQRIQLTRAKALQTIGQYAQPVVASTYAAHRCGLLLSRDAVLMGNMSNDLTSEVVAGLDRKITTISFNLEPLPANTQTPASSQPMR